MTKEQYDWACNRIAELMNPELQPLGSALTWELIHLTTDCVRYENEHIDGAVSEK